MSFNPFPGRGRGGYAPRRGRGGFARPFVKNAEPVKPDLIKHPLGELLVSLQASDSDQSEPRAPRIDDCQYVTSYNWVLGKDSTILVPGQPPQWTPPKINQRLSEDSDIYYRDPNAARYPEYPIAPAVQAVMDATNDGPIDADLFACGSTLGNLLRFVRRIDKAFRFNVEVIGETVFFIRKENDPKEIIQGVHGFGHTFPDAYTTWPKDVKGSETHQRIVQYDLGGLQCLVRFECDGFIDNIKSPSSSTARKQGPLPASHDDLIEGFSTLHSKTIMATSQTSKGPLIIQHAGEIVSQSAIFDLKTRSGRYKKEINMDDITPQLWLKQIPNFIVAYHDGAGLFKDIQIRDVKPLTAAFERDNAGSIRRLVALLKKIIHAARADPRGLLDVYCPGGDVLQIRQQFGDGVHALPAALEGKWVASCDGGGLVLGNQDAGEDEDTGYGAFEYRDYDEVGASYYESDESERDFTACSAHDCGYCGKCSY